MGNDLPKPLKMLGFQSKVMGNDPPKPLKMLGFRSKVMDNDPPKPLKMLGFRSKVMGRKGASKPGWGGSKDGRVVSKQKVVSKPG